MTVDEVSDATAEFVFDYDEPADLYFPVQVGRKGGLDYRRFPSAAHALRYALESLPSAKLASATMEVNGERYDSIAMRRLYASPACSVI